jgi:glycosyltransferase involved in cell wall biosynthesis
VSAPPPISALIPVRDGVRYLGEAIASVLAQEIRPIEVVVLDDGSRDDSAALARSFGGAVRVVAQAHAGIGAARNRLVQEATGDLLAFLDADDRWCPGALAAHVASLADAPAAAMAFGLVRQFVTPELPAEERARLVCPRDPARGFIPGASLIRRHAFARAGAFRTDLRVGEFVDWLMRARDAGLVATTHETTVLERRLHGSNTGRRERAAADYLAVVRAALARRRSGEAP